MHLKHLSRLVLFVLVLMSSTGAFSQESEQREPNAPIDNVELNDEQSGAEEATEREANTCPTTPSCPCEDGGTENNELSGAEEATEREANTCPTTPSCPCEDGGTENDELSGAEEATEREANICPPSPSCPCAGGGTDNDNLAQQ